VVPVDEAFLVELDRRLAEADAELATLYPGDRGVRQPVHTVYVPADRFHAGAIGEWAQGAKEALDRNARSHSELAKALDLPTGLPVELYDRVLAKLEREPIEDLRIDFEDGYGARPDEDEDAAAIGSARALAELVRTGDGRGTERTGPAVPPYHGLRIKSLEAPTRRRGVRTLDLFVGELVRAEALTDGFVITLAKVTSVEQIETMVLVLDAIEQAHGVPAGALKFEIQVETPQAILGPDGTTPLGRMIKASAGRVTGLHYGTYDYSASLGIAAAYQSMEHPVADHAKDIMQLAAAGTGVFVCDGSTNVLPIGEREDVHAAWRLHLRLVRRSLARGIYQGWDMHPAQLPTRYVATYLFYRESLDSAATRLRAYVSGGDSGYLDEPATAAALATYVLRGLECGATDQAELDTLIGIDAPTLAKLARRLRS
jgi:citrate lyase beta subunit